MKQKEKPEFRISVRDLVEFILRSGDLVSGGNIRDAESMQKGSRLHRKIQKQMGSHYEAEVSLKRETEFDDLVLLVEGRADGIFRKKDIVCIDEIKGTHKVLSAIKEPVPVHRAQALCYAWIYLDKNELDTIDVQITYGNLDTEEIKRFRETFSREELKKWYHDLIWEYHKWISFKLAWRKKRNASMENLEFPFAYRKGQREMVTGVYHAVNQKKQIFIQAPTGIGKTMSAVFPAVRAVGEKKAETIFYLTARTVARTVAEGAFSILRDKGLSFKTVTLTAKEKLCFSEECDCDPEKCPCAKGHYDRINEAVFELLTAEDAFDRETILKQAEKHQVCPFEMSLDLSEWVDAVICDYNYVFDPDVRLKRFFGENISGKYIFLIDEAHNLVERGREMYSAVLYQEEFRQIKKLIKKENPRLGRLLTMGEHELRALCPETEEWRIVPRITELSLALINIRGEMERLLDDDFISVFPDQMVEFYFHVRTFLNISAETDENYVIYTTRDEDGKYYLKLFCVNPARKLQQCLDKGVSAVFFSATLLPLTYYRRMLSTRTENFGMYVYSPFSRENRTLLIGSDVSSLYTRRGYGEYRKMAEYIARMSWQKRGNYMAFFPSYKLMDAVYEIYQDEFSADWVRCIRQQPSMTEREREEFLKEFSESAKETLIGFCVMGGVFSEGIDLIGDRLIGAVIVGTGLPQVSTEREILKNYYDEKKENGFDYAYRLPGMNKVLQASGRVIRTKEDTGAILLLDERFNSREYRSLFPREWEDARTCTLRSVETVLKEFWKGRKKEKS